MRLQLSSGCSSDSISETVDGPRQPAIPGKHRGYFGEAEVWTKQGRREEPSGCGSRIMDQESKGVRRAWVRIVRMELPVSSFLRPWFCASRFRARTLHNFIRRHQLQEDIYDREQKRTMHWELHQGWNHLKKTLALELRLQREMEDGWMSLVIKVPSRCGRITPAVEISICSLYSEFSRNFYINRSRSCPSVKSRYYFTSVL